MAEWKRIKRAPAYEVSDEGFVRNAETKRPMWGSESNGYRVVELRDAERKSIYAHIHVLVLEAFVSDRPEAMEAGHLNGKRWDNRLSNLSWVTKKEHAEHKRLHGTATIGSRHPKSKLTEDDVRSIRARFHQVGRSRGNADELAREFGVTPKHIWKVARGFIWKSV